ncbi:MULTISPECIES: carbohydrate kinase family protein [unclassified Coleofasciculus]|uniref:carbohydrate kinase family protein n=1 Tax=unclassified Coleofasciculus TaxID=2692782 RepID=UPI0018827B19|nr:MULTISPECIES: carbohydrate kinase [unclassified Coleofasciculus]MBE9126135.1 carbohydrate kinase [Coleofasciculus sp. LEGE 07081]MBE9149553.1 carbohydrate kinase [Coleofasciculus sp. LEGE 07092]
MTHPRVLCLGEVLFDRLADQLGRPVEQVESWTDYPGGAPANVATALVKLGTPAGFIGCVGQDKPGNELVQLLEDIGVDITGVQRHPTAPTRQVYVVRSEKGDREFAGFGDLDTSQFADAFLNVSELPESLFVHADYLVLGTLELAYSQTRDAIDRALQLAELYDVKVVVDINWRPMFWHDPSIAKPLIQERLKQVDFLKIAREEAELLFDTADAGAITHRLDSLEGVLVTDGDRDTTYCLSEQEGKFSPFTMDVQDTTGAGDGFVAGFVHQLCQQGLKCIATPESAKNVVKYASAVGGLTTLKPGAIAAQPTADKVAAFLQEKDK